ncbi:hypothetical protein V6N13_076288 [Hibiscus sabdariffa]
MDKKKPCHSGWFFSHQRQQGFQSHAEEWRNWRLDRNNLKGTRVQCGVFAWTQTLFELLLLPLTFLRRCGMH